MNRDRYSLKRLCAGVLALPLAAGILLARPGRASQRVAGPDRDGVFDDNLRVLASPSFAAPFASAAKPAGGPSVFSPDKGKFRILINGQSIGSEDFEISQSGDAWIQRSSMSAHAPDGGEIKATGQLKLSPDGAPLHYDWSAEAQKKATGAVDFQSGTAKCVADLGAASPLRKDFVFNSPRVAVLDNNLYYQFGVLARVYDWKAGGKQTFPVLIPQDMVPGSISVESLGPQQAGSGKYEAVRVSSPDLEITVYLDESHRMMRLEVPSSNVIVERQ